jgi:hypothetical protein
MHDLNEHFQQGLHSSDGSRKGDMYAEMKYEPRNASCCVRGRSYRLPSLTCRDGSRVPYEQNEASFSSENWGEKYCIRISVAFCLYLVKIIQILTN